MERDRPSVQARRSGLWQWGERSCSVVRVFSSDAQRQFHSQSASGVTPGSICLPSLLAESCLEHMSAFSSIISDGEVVLSELSASQTEQPWSLSRRINGLMNGDRVGRASRRFCLAASPALEGLDLRSIRKYVNESATSIPMQAPSSLIRDLL